MHSEIIFSTALVKPSLLTRQLQLSLSTKLGRKTGKFWVSDAGEDLLPENQ